jgi:alpha-L-rhamnosidase
MDYMTGFVTNGLISRDNYGDWCVPPEDLHLIHSKDPARKTDTTLLATAYFYHDARLTAQQAALLGFSKDVERFDALAEELKAAFNRKFFNEVKGLYDNGSQSSCVIPLSFGLVPAGQELRVFNTLVRNITEKTDNHLGTGLIGGQWLMRVLSDYGRADLAFTIATNRSYPSWGYMADQGATTIWELWNGNTADPAMNSGNHVMLVGDLVIWMHEYLAGIRPAPGKQGFKQLLMRPQLISGLDWVNASHDSPQGKVLSEWRRTGNQFVWRITIPPNSEASVYLPTMAPENVLEKGRAISRVKGIEIISWKEGFLQLAIGSGTYEFRSVLPEGQAGMPVASAN